ncbi:GTPase-activating protein [Frankliniella occidentalis]|uniref:GTPase-activating protein n=1 Tax=Frankliniella occidentalis TaxID=133901 RepID=A0A6J1S6U0_FRAOC|nr:GTPase-activating protein [Frankliniella occidentalis]
MADVKGKVRVVERLKIKIGEAKNLPSRSHGSINQRDVYCALSLDQEEIFRTETIEKTLSPFFSEDFQFEVPRRFRYLSVYIYDRDRHLKQDKVIGKVAVKREELHSYHSKDHWFPILPVDADSEVQGKAHIDVKFEAVVKANSHLEHHNSRLTVRLIECNELTLKNGACDPFATVTVKYSNGKQETKKAKVKKKTSSPHFDETFIFELPSVRGQNHDREWQYRVSDACADVDWSELVISLWHDSAGMSDKIFLGEVRISLGGVQQQNHAATNAWYFLQPRSLSHRPTSKQLNSPASARGHSNSLGSLRLNIQYTADHVFSSHVYNGLRDLLLQSVNAEPVTSSAAYILGAIIPSKEDTAQPLVKLFLHHGQLAPTITNLARWEISKVTDPNTIFRGNTLVSKMMDEAMKLVGLHYLHNTLRPTLDLVFQEHKPCEIDPSRVEDPSQIQTNLLNLKDYVEKIFTAITNSAIRCPTLMCQLFHNLKELATSYFPENKEVRYSVISGFIFLRFFAPAILGPKLFDLTTEQIDSQTKRTLTLISKTIQSLGNLVSSTSLQREYKKEYKEEYMACVFDSVYTESRVLAVRQFLEIISATSNPTQRNLDSPVVLKEGVMIKRAQGRKRFGRKNFKQRYFRLTTQDLTYSKNKGKEPLCCIPLNQILAVEKLQEDSFKKNYMFQIVQPERALYIQANNCVEEKEWIDILTKICQTNANRLSSYHPSAYINGHWLCCRAQSEAAAGCSEVSTTVDATLQMNLDPDRELQRIHSLVISNIDRLENLVVASGDTNLLSSFMIEEKHSFSTTLKQLQDTIFSLEQEHRTYLRSVARETKYGSKQAPIGDDNYLLLAARVGRLDNSHIRQTQSLPMWPVQ